MVNMRIQTNRVSGYFQFAGNRYWTASLLPALIGTTLPFWLNPPDFKFKLIEAVLFLIAAFLGHVGFSFLYFGFTQKSNIKLEKKSLLILGIISLTISALIGLFINSSLQLHRNVPEYIFLIYGITTIFAGVLYVVPPFSFYKRFYGEVIISIGLGMLPVLGAYLVQVGDISRTVYLASLPVVVSIGLWIWVMELISKEDDKTKGYKTTVMYFNNKFSGRIITIFLTLLIYLSLIFAVFVRPSLNPLSLIALFSLIFALMIVKIIWKGYENIKVLQNVRKYAFLIHLSICIVFILASLVPILYMQ
jgi:1,4-dihydroxy-2-naphthoate octaprenyltransferase